ncbi:MAG TPA: catecholate siderophore receptor Fiu, partial [Spongiibacteraceae bacterium]|nr:catecholate siderophore receptor Fiu [Spongiibacteraceae bacterium]
SQFRSRPDVWEFTMNHIRNRKLTKAAPRFTQSLLTLAMAAPLAGHAQTTENEQVLNPVKVQSSAEIPFKNDISANSKYTQPLLDTPQTVQVIKKEVLQEQGAVSLMEALRNTPGITMQLGENGNTSAGDTFQMRGFSTQNSTFVDGIRDLGAVTRDVFNLEQIEVVKGPAGADIGRGAASGYINLISKLPTQDSVNMATFSLGTAAKKRGTLDLNEGFGETGGFRLNAMSAQGDVDERDVVENKSWAIAPSFALGLGTPTRVYVFAQTVRQNNIPDGGIPSIGFDDFYALPSYTPTGSTTPINTATTQAQAAALIKAPKVDRSNFYGTKNDYEDVSADMITIKFEHDLDAKTIIRNISRYGKTEMDRVVTGISAPSVSANTVNRNSPANSSTLNLLYLDPNNPNAWAVTPNRQRIDRENEILANQTSLSTEFNTGALKHSVAGGLEFMYERQKSLTFGTAAATINGVSYAAISNPPANIYNPNNDVNRGVPYATGAYTDGDTKTAAFYAFDTLELTPQWLLNGGLRYEHYRTGTDSSTLVTTDNASTFKGYTAGQLAPASLDDNGNLLSWKTGVIFKPLPNGSIYLSYATSETPPGSADFALSATDNNQNNSALDPQKTDNYELGTKWNLLNDRLSLTAAYFRTENDKQTSFDDLNNPVQTGRTLVKGVEVAMVGQLTNFWQLSAGITKMTADALDQQSNTGVETTGVRWTPELSATLWTSYTLGDFTIGGGARYLGDQERTVTVGAPQNGLAEIPSYWVADAMVAYRISKSINLRLNVYNLFDEDYIETLNNGGNRVRMGQPRSGMLTAEYSF